MSTTITRWRSVFATIGFDQDRANELCLLKLWVERGLIGGLTDGQESVLDGMRTWTVQPYTQVDGIGGWWLLCDGRPENWFPGYERALNAARDRNNAETLRIQYLREGRGS